MPKTLILIPSRMAASRLPGKPLLKINNLSIILHVYERAKKANIGDVVVATQDLKILEEVENNGGKAILTGNQHKTGTDRIFECFKKLKISDVDYIINLQGDEPAINHADIVNLNNFMILNKSDIGTLASEIKDNKILLNENVVKVITKEKLNNNNFPIALNFTRKELSKNSQNIYHHIGMYAYKVKVLEKIVNLNQTKNEVKNRLEQLRALDNDIKINVALTKSSPIGVDTKEDYLDIKKIMEYKL
jgi:3-deoxy-manno-octulosonate cytidylyltransferase (CMP-KDO synthetase)